MNVLFLAGVSPETAKSDMLNKILKNHFTYLALDKRVKVVTIWTFINYSVDVDSDNEKNWDRLDARWGSLLYPFWNHCWSLQTDWLSCD